MYIVHISLTIIYYKNIVGGNLTFHISILNQLETGVDSTLSTPFINTLIGGDCGVGFIHTMHKRLYKDEVQPKHLVWRLVFLDFDMVVW